MSFQQYIHAIVPNALATDGQLSHTAVRLINLMQNRQFSSQVELAREAHMSRTTVLRAFSQLEAAGWAVDARNTRTNKRILAASLPARVEQQIADLIEGDRFNVTYVGEWLMRCWLDALVHSLDYLDNARPSWVRNIESGRRMEFDRHYRNPPVVFEFQGPQHFVTTQEFADKEKQREQQKRDDRKAGICARHHIRFVEITAADLTLDRMLAHIPLELPLRSYNEDQPIIRTLARLSEGYYRAR
ncbi:MAG: winged helix-turn-helix domain-containing protein [Firmicutes bacterium]|jgi:biotin operon repressor|nr:winged helix-turn-helix domain-containing protein [Bacillota bacterium]MDD4336024.1 winged helix-turn-helix domain-containing protein [Bacillota bacterium]MDD4793448.1 winged helix-turn-helix domain-containing protein [Bacillota bacterium]